MDSNPKLHLKHSCPSIALTIKIGHPIQPSITDITLYFYPVTVYISGIAQQGFIYSVLELLDL